MALIPFAVLVGLFFSLMSHMGEQGRLKTFHFELEDIIKPLSLRIVGFFIVLQFVDSWASGFPSIDGVWTVFLGVAKAFSWYFSVQSVRQSLLTPN